MPWYDVCSIADIPAHRGWPVRVAGYSIAVFRDGTTVRAVENRCQHLGAPLDDGWVDRGCVTCPWHGWRYDLATGSVVGSHGRPPHLRTYPVRVDDDRVLVEVDVDVEVEVAALSSEH
jgi:nitrite reductase/ring-hydroxylating ferredoxin subunit